MTAVLLDPVLVDTRIRLAGQFRDTEGEAQDPPTARLLIRRPDGTVEERVFGEDPEILRDDPGLYHVFVVLDLVGSWWFQWRGEGGAGPLVAGEGTVRVLKAVIS